MTAENIVSQAIIKILRLYPFYGNIIIAIGRTENTAVQSFKLKADSNSSASLHYNPEFVLKIKERYAMAEDVICAVAGYIFHDVAHISLLHIERIKNYANKNIYGLATDLVVNQLVPNRKQDIHKNAISNDNWLEQNAITIGLIEKLLKISLEHNQTTAYYYEKLLPFEEKLTEFSDGVSDTHSEWEDISNSEVITNKFKNAINKAFNNNKASYGNLSGEQKEVLEEINKPLIPNVDWKKMLGMYAQNSEKTYTKSSRNKQSRRFGTFPGIKIKKSTRLLVCIDTSGSISNTDLREFFGEINHIYESGAEIHIFECDTDISGDVYEYDGVMPKFVTGRGGTDMNPAMEHFGESDDYDGLIYFTDGFIPTINNYYIQPLWIITPDGVNDIDNFESNFGGMVVKMKAQL